MTNGSSAAAGTAPLELGVLALQGAVDEHLQALRRCGASARPVKTAAQLERIDGLVIPGGESTTVIRLLDRFAMTEPLRKRVHAGLPVWGSCMGMIVLAREIEGLEQRSLGLLDVSVRRNAFGRQSASAEVPLAVPVLGAQPFPAVFIRAPWIERAGSGVEILAERDGHGVLVRERHMLGSSFHPELSGDDRLHRYFIAMVESYART